MRLTWLKVKFYPLSVSAYVEGGNRASWRKWITPNTTTLEFCGGHVLKHKKTTEEKVNMSL